MMRKKLIVTGDELNLDASYQQMAQDELRNKEHPDDDGEFDLDEYLGTHLSEFDGYLGKSLLISLTYLYPTGEVRHKSQTHGIITRINEAIIAVQRQDTGDEFTLPAKLDALEPAPEGEYRLKPSGTVVVNPDYLVVFTIQEPQTPLA